MLPEVSRESILIAKFVAPLYRVLNASLLVCYACLMYFSVRNGMESGRLLWALGWTVLLVSLSYGHLKHAIWAPRYSFYILFLMLVFQPDVLLVDPEMSEAVYSSYGALLAWLELGALASVIASERIVELIEKTVKQMPRARRSIRHWTEP